MKVHTTTTNLVRIWTEVKLWAKPGEFRTNYVRACPAGVWSGFLNRVKRGRSTLALFPNLETEEDQDSPSSSHAN